MSLMLAVFCLAGLSAVIAAVVGRVLIRIGPKDHPDGDRKLQREAMPTAGGIALLAGVLPANLALFLFEPDWLSTLLVVMFFGGLCMFVLGLWDDIAALPAIPKLLIQIGLAALVAFFGVRVETLDLGRHLIEVGFVFGLMGSVTWLIVVTNAVNFMDGSDGLAVGSGAAVSAGLALIAALTEQWDIAALSVIMCAGLLGLLVWNGRGKLFAGDTGALFIGFYLGCLALLLVARVDVSVWIAPCLFVAFLTDVLLTLIWRFRHGRSLMTPHREHIYQLIIASGRSHMLTAWIYVWITVHGVLIAGISLVFPRGLAMLGFLLLTGILFWLSQKIRRSAIDAGLLVP